MSAVSLPLEESSRVEFKRELNAKLEREVVAFLNSNEGGTIYLGIDDSGRPVGIENPDAVQLKVTDRIKTNISPSALGLYDVLIERLDNLPIIKVVVSSGPEKPYYLKSMGMSPQGCFMRVGSSALPMDSHTIDNLYASRTRNTLRNIRSPRQNLSFEQLRIYYQEHGLALNDRFAETLDLLTQDGAYNYTAYLLADENGLSMKVARYAGTDKRDLIENDEYGYCSIVTATKRVLDRLYIENTTKTKITARERIERTLVDRTALREVAINAVVHNDYTEEVPPVFEIFSDRIEITSYGGLVPGMSKEDLFACCSKPRNRELMRVFKDLDLVEHLGSGMARILGAYDRSVFDITEHFIHVRLPFSREALALEELPVGMGADRIPSVDATYRLMYDPVNEPVNATVNHMDEPVRDTVKRWGDKLGSLSNGHQPPLRITARQQSLIGLIRQNPYITYERAASVLGVSRSTIHRDFRSLAGIGVIERIGSDKMGFWRITQPQE